MKITEFKEQIILKLIKRPESPTKQIYVNHILTKISSLRKKCSSCYKKLETEFGRKQPQKKCLKVTTACTSCKMLTCMPCFFETHVAKLKNKTKY